MYGYSIPPFEELVEQFERLPGIGRKTAYRLAYYILKLPKEEAEKFANTISAVQSKIHYCKVCYNITDKEICSICENKSRDKSLICVVEDPKDVSAFERTGEFGGTYHVLHGTISPMNGVGPDKIRIGELLNRVKSSSVKEVIMATNPTVEGEATAMYISRVLKPIGVKVTRLAYGIPVGGDLEYADEITLQRSIQGRSEI